ncbi:cytosine permease [Nocardioides sp. B-3]|uniref:cytosine permease n=1 Tax=Nocardioides sp. B-3 TaxID=2895565 RepID=UPI00300E33BC
MGHRSAVNQMVIGRSPFGIRGASIPGAVQCLLTMAWVGVNTRVVLDPVLALLGKFGIEGGLALEYLVAAIIMVVQLLLALYGFYAIRSFEKWTVPITVAVMAVMTVVAVGQADVNWSQGTVNTTGERVTAITQLATAIGVGWGISWIPYSADYSRFVSTKVSGRSVFWASTLGMFVPTVWLAALGALLASSGDNSDPSALVVNTFGILAVPVLLLIMHGPVATNILNLYSCSLAALSIGVKMARWKLTLLAGLVASAVLVVFVRADSFAQTFDHWMVSIPVWISPRAAIVLVDYFVVRRGRLDVPELFETPARSIYGAYNVRGLLSLGVRLVAARVLAVRLGAGDAGATRYGVRPDGLLVAERRCGRGWPLLPARSFARWIACGVDRRVAGGHGPSGLRSPADAGGNPKATECRTPGRRPRGDDKPGARTV